jgi:hypothetical protein
MNQSGMPGATNSAAGAMDMQKTNAMAGAMNQTPAPGIGPSAPPPDMGLKDFMQPHPTNDMQVTAMNQPPGIQPSGETQLADQTINSTPPADGLLSNPKTQQTINNANAAIGIGSTVNGLLSPQNAPSPGGFPARPFQMPNSVLGLQSIFRR